MYAQSQRIQTVAIYQGYELRQWTMITFLRLLEINLIANDGGKVDIGTKRQSQYQISGTTGEPRSNPNAVAAFLLG